MYKYITAYLVVAFSISLTAQDRSNYQLLWRVKNPGATKASYLFGTAHIKDEKAFAFSDSVLSAFQNTDALALEISMDDYLREISVENDKKENEEDLFISEIGEQNYEKLREKLKEDIDFDIDELKTKSPLIIRRLFSERFNKSEDNELTLDSYLYDIAKGQGKEVYGLEKMDHGIRSAGGFESSFEKEIFIKELIEEKGTIIQFTPNKKEMDGLWDDFVSLYYEGDVDKIYQKYRASAEAYGDPFQVEDRNKLMVDKADTLLQNQSLFMAVGAAHLGGEQGMIELLREKGYVVEAVEASFTGVSEDLMEYFEKNSGYLLEDITAGYRIRMDGRPVKSAIQGSNLSMYIYSDVKGESSTLVMSVENPDISLDNKAALTLAVENISLRFGEEAIRENKFIEYQGLEGIQLELDNRGSFNLFYLFKRGNQVYMFGNVKTYERHSKSEARKFLKSIELFNVTRRVTTWEPIKDKNQYFTSLFPKNYTYVNRKVPMDEEGNEVEVTVYSAIDDENNSHIITSYAYPPGFKVSADSIMFGLMDDLIGQQYVTEKQRELDFVVGRYKGKKSIYKNANGNKMIHSTIMRGNKIFSLLSQLQDSNSTASDKFLRSFTLDSIDTNWELHPYITKEGGYSIMAPKNTSEREHEFTYEYHTDSTWMFSATDEQADLLLLVQESTFYPYTYFENFDSIVDLYYDVNELPGTSLLYDSTIKTNGIPQYYEVLVRDSSVSYLSKERLYVRGRRLYIVQALFGLEIDPSSVDAIFESFKINQTDTFNVYERKTEQLFNDLKSRDTNTFSNAVSQLSDYEFEPSETKGLYDLISTPMPLDTSSFMYASPRRILMRKLTMVPDSNTLSFLVNYYDTTSSKEMRQTIISSLQNLDSEEADLAYLKRLPSIDFDIYYPTYFYDTVTHVLDSMEYMFTLMKNSYLSQDVLFIFKHYLETDSMFRDSLIPYKSQFINYFNACYDTTDLSGLSYYAAQKLVTSLNVITRLGGEVSLSDKMKEALECNNPELQASALAEMVQTNQRVKKKLVKKLLKDHGFHVLWELEAIGKQNYLEKYWKQEDATRAFILGMMYYDDYEIKNLEFIQFKEIELEGETKRVYFYTYEDTYYDEGKVLAFTGAQPNSKKINFEEDYTNTWFCQYDPETLKEDIERALADFKELVSDAGSN